MYIKYISFVFISINLEAFAYRHCKDCVNIPNCPPANDYLQPNIDENVQKIRNAYCGFNGQGAMVCCSKFSQPQDDVTSHPNINLLPKVCGDNALNRIFGGVEALLYELPWMALISYHIDNGLAFQCSGSVINSRYILTAAHCILDMNIAGVRIGELDLRYENDCLLSPDPSGGVCEAHIDIKVEEAISHEKYVGYPKYAYDIGLLRLEHDIDFSRKNAAPICLPTTKELRSASIANKIATVAGWGLTEKQKTSAILLKVNVPVKPDEECIDIYSRILEESEPNQASSQFCAGTHHKDSCDGDSGAPLIIQQKIKKVYGYVQYGIVSQGRPNCGGEIPAVYTAVSAFMPWILDNMKP